MLLCSIEHFSLVIFHYFGLLLQTGNGKVSLTNRTEQKMVQTQITQYEASNPVSTMSQMILH